jgi:hypothetical protein
MILIIVTPQGIPHLIDLHVEEANIKMGCNVALLHLCQHTLCILNHVPIALNPDT